MDLRNDARRSWWRLPGELARWLDSLPSLAWLGFLTGTAAAARLSWWLLVAKRVPIFDEVGYLGNARRLADGLGYVDATGAPTAFWPPGFPFLVSLVFRAGGDLGATIGVQVGLGVLLALIVTRLATADFGRPAGRLAGLACGLYPNLAMFSTLFLAETLFTLLLAAAALCAIAPPSGRERLGAVLCGGLLAGAVLTRPVAILFPLLLPLVYLRRHRALRPAAVASALTLGAFLVALAPWLVRNHAHFGTWSPSTTGAYNFWIGNHPEALGGYAHGPLPHKNEIERGSSIGFTLGWQSVREHPVRAVARSIAKLSYFFALETDGVLSNLKGLSASPPLSWALPLLAVANLAYVTLVIATSAAVASGGWRTPTGLYLVLLTADLAAMSVIFIGDPRYHFPLVPFAIPVAVSWLVDALPRQVERLRSGDPAALRGARRFAAVVVAWALLMAANLYLKKIEFDRGLPARSPVQDRVRATNLQAYPPRNRASRGGALYLQIQVGSIEISQAGS
ncbi:MAG: hypothetical protein R3190_07820 [Thermoanaerobaculia bacterium]|nr:hypothetical protein [Thermoanaerobaculia bacterium]